MGVGGQHHAPAALPPGKTRYPLYRRLGGPQGGSRKISPPLGFDPRTVEPVASRYTDWAIPAHHEGMNHFKIQFMRVGGDGASDLPRDKATQLPDVINICVILGFSRGVRSSGTLSRGTDVSGQPIYAA